MKHDGSQRYEFSSVDTLALSSRVPTLPRPSPFAVVWAAGRPFCVVTNSSSSGINLVTSPNTNHYNVY